MRSGTTDKTVLTPDAALFCISDRSVIPGAMQLVFEWFYMMWSLSDCSLQTEYKPI